ncbi:MAG: hypothetical protein IKP33_09150 [Prevotella sp.]|jgi:membrane-associated phospholipid phosphatase|nr:hypothetical protein [Prevotella sp.]
MREKDIILTAKVISVLFTPFYLPLVGLLVLFLFSYMGMLFPWSYKLIVLILVYLFTILLPTVMIYAYRRYHGWTLIELGNRKRRMVPYIISMISYYCCVYVMQRLHMPHFMSCIVIAGLMVQILCALVNVWWKISTHMAAIGGVAGALMAFAELFSFNPVWWLSLLFILSGILGSSRLILRQHTLLQVVVGFFLGVFCGMISILFL